MHVIILYYSSSRIEQPNKVGPKEKTRSRMCHASNFACESSKLRKQTKNTQIPEVSLYKGNIARALMMTSTTICRSRDFLSPEPTFKTRPSAGARQIRPIFISTTGDARSIMMLASISTSLREESSAGTAC